MAERTTGAKLTLAISDVPGDDLSVIARGPTVAGAGLESGRFETPKPGDARLAGQQARITATPQFSLEAAAALARGAALGLSAAEALDRHHACGHFAALSDLVVTGPTPHP